MGLKCKEMPKSMVLLQAGSIYAWLTVLSPLSVTDTYYSVYLLCAVAGLLCLADNYKKAYDTAPGQKRILLIFAVLFSGAVALANYALFEPLSVMQNLFDLGCCLAGGVSIGGNILLCALNRFPLVQENTPKVHRGGGDVCCSISFSCGH